MANELTPADILSQLHDHLADWCAARGGKLSIAEDAYHVLELLAENPIGFRVILHWDGDENASADIDDGIDQHRIEAIVTKNRGLQARRGENLIEARGGVPLLKLVGQVKAKLRASDALWEAGITQGELEYRGCDVVTTPEGIPLDAYRLRFAILAARSTDTDEEEAP